MKYKVAWSVLSLSELFWYDVESSNYNQCASRCFGLLWLRVSERQWTVLGEKLITMYAVAIQANIKHVPRRSD